MVFDCCFFLAFRAHECYECCDLAFEKLKPFKRALHGNANSTMEIGTKLTNGHFPKNFKTVCHGHQHQRNIASSSPNEGTPSKRFFDTCCLGTSVTSSKQRVCKQNLCGNCSFGKPTRQKGRPVSVNLSRYHSLNILPILVLTSSITH